MTRTEIINGIIEKNDYKSYLEIGVYDMKNFNAINCEFKQGVDPNVIGESIVTKSSNDYFNNMYDYKDSGYGYDLIFIDGDHTYKQSKEDLENALLVLKEGGLILMHDSNPNNIQEMTPNNNGKAWCGEVWKTVYDAVCDGYRVVTIPDDYGVSIIKNEEVIYKGDAKEVTPQEFLKRKSELINFISYRDYMNITEELKDVEKKQSNLDKETIEDIHKLVEEQNIERIKTMDEVVQEDLEAMTDVELKEFHKVAFGYKPKGKFNRDKVIEKIIN